MNIAIIGLGLIGGSAAIDLRKRGFAGNILGVDKDEVNAKTAQHIGFVDEITDLETAIDRSDIILLSIPVSSALSILPKILDQVKDQVVADMCSTKEDLIKCVADHPKRKQFVATHPMAGTEFSGPWAAKSGLFDGKATIFCDTEDSSEVAVETMKRMYEALNMRVIYMKSSNHDVHAAYVSHISHISSFALALTVLEKEKNETNIFDLASGGFDSTVRLAKSSADMWAPIFNHNKVNVLTVLDTYIENLQKFRNSINDENIAEIHDLIKESNRIKRVL